MTYQSAKPPTTTRVDGAGGAPAGRDEAVHAAAVEPVQPPQRQQRDGGRDDRQQHRRQLQRRSDAW